jgi:hypothetical protein
MHQSPLTDLTRSFGAVFSPKDDWEMPDHYGTAQNEYEHAHSGAVLRDASHLTRLKISGADHLAFLHRMSTNHFNDLAPGAGFLAILPDNRGRILAVGSFCRLGAFTLALLGPADRERLPAWFDRYIFTEAIALEDLHPETGMVELFGPLALPLARKVLDLDLTAAADGHLLGPTNAPMPWFIRTDRCGTPGVRLIATPDQLIELWNQLQDAGAVPLGEASWETRRIEAGIPHPGHELTETHNPWEAGLGEAIHMNKGCYIGQEVIARLDTYDKVKQTLMGLRLSSGPLPSPNSELHKEGKQAGTITSVTYSPRLAGPIALAYIRRAYCEPGTQIHLETAGSLQTAQVVSLPFI